MSKTAQEKQESSLLHYAMLKEAQAEEARFDARLREEGRQWRRECVQRALREPDARRRAEYGRLCARVWSEELWQEAMDEYSGRSRAA